MNTNTPQSASYGQTAVGTQQVSALPLAATIEHASLRIFPLLFLLLCLIVFIAFSGRLHAQSPSNLPPIDKLNSRLFDLGGQGGDVLDANVVVFNNAYSNAVNGDDALKMSNSSENFAIKRDGRLLVVEGRQAIVEFDTVYFELWNLQLQQYTFEFDARFANMPGLTATLLDRYLNTSRSLKINDTTRINFTCDANAGSRARDRFRVIFRKPLNSLPVRFVSLSANRINSKTVVDWQVDGEYGVRYYEVEKSLNGREFNIEGRVAAQAGPATAVRRYVWEQNNSQDVTAYYRVRNVDISGATSYSPIVKLEGMKKDREAVVFPNPVTGKAMNIRLNRFERGAYTVEVISSYGTVMCKTTVNHFGGNTGYGIQLPQSLPAGVYSIRLTGNNEITILPGIQVLN